LSVLAVQQRLGLKLANQKAQEAEDAKNAKIHDELTAQITSTKRNVPKASGKAPAKKKPKKGN
jgi:hypothetical protein